LRLKSDSFVSKSAQCLARCVDERSANRRPVHRVCDAAAAPACANSDEPAPAWRAKRPVVTDNRAHLAIWI
jgi:hypothetical protein